MNVVLDAFAVIAFLRGEPGTDVVESYFSARTHTGYMHTLNLCEVYYDFLRASNKSSAEMAIAGILRLGVHERADLDPVFWRSVGKRTNAESHLRTAARSRWGQGWERSYYRLTATSLNLWRALRSAPFNSFGSAAFSYSFNSAIVAPVPPSLGLAG